MNTVELLILIQWLQRNGFNATAEGLIEMFRPEIEGLGRKV